MAHAKRELNYTPTFRPLNWEEERNPSEINLQIFHGITGEVYPDGAIILTPFYVDIQGNPFTVKCAQGDRKKISQMLPCMLERQDEIEIQAQINDGLQVAFSYNQLEMCRFFFTCPEINFENWKEKQNRIFETACLHENLKFVKWALDIPNFDLLRTSTALKIVCMKGNVDLLELFLGHAKTIPQVLQTGFEFKLDSRCHEMIVTHLRASRFNLIFTIKTLSREVRSIEPGLLTQAEIRHTLLPQKLEARRELQWDTEIFVLTVLLSDGYLEFKNHVQGNKEKFRFFKILQSLPMEIQTIICKKIVDSNGTYFTSNQVNHYFQRVLMKF